MEYILVIWTIVASAGNQFNTHDKYDWRPIGVFQKDTTQGFNGGASGLERCEEAARQLNINADRYRCVRSK
jgi:hypothetical protein